MLVSSGITWSEYASCIEICTMLLLQYTAMSMLALLKISWQHIFTEELNCSKENEFINNDFELTFLVWMVAPMKFHVGKIFLHDRFSAVCFDYGFCSLFINDAESYFISVPVLCFLLCIMGHLHIWMIKTDFDMYNFECVCVCDVWEWMMFEAEMCVTKEHRVVIVCVFMLTSL